ncbi:lipoprotein LpqH [Gulosibacter sp. ACHW.36C]|uniref:Lipoprotein LpqH n=1 Tax=Gulosibacter sediminis TaxID=1729695 RepID=A0ABY4N0Z4_9MICO|nr:lipoprotein LpqH [Gulosibacter sediminis]UQN15173.1 lipoprotein LpqH [Gulosibacter sediminis]
MNRKHLISLAAAATLLASLTACSSGDAEEPATDSNQDSADTGSNESEDTTTEDGGSEEGGASSGSGDFSLTIDGQAVEFSDAQVACADSEMGFAISVTSPDLDAAAGQSVGAVLASADDPTVTAVGVTDADGNSLAYAEGTGQGSAEATVDGNTYTISGEGLSTNIADATSVETLPFELTVTCP